MLRAGLIRTGALVVIVAAIAYCVLLLSVAHAYPWVSWGALSWTALRVLIGIIAGAALFAVILVVWARAR